MAAISATGKPSTALSRKAWRGSGVIDSSLRSDRRQAARLHIGLEIDTDRVPQAGEGAVQGDAGIDLGIEQRWVLDQHFERGRHIGVARRLGAGKRPRKPPQIRKMRRNRLGYRHALLTLWC